MWAGKALLVHERAPSGSFLAALSAHFLFRKVGSTLVPVRLGFQEDAVGSPTQARVRRGLLTPTNAPPPPKEVLQEGWGGQDAKSIDCLICFHAGRPGTFSTTFLSHRWADRGRFLAMRRPCLGRTLPRAPGGQGVGVFGSIPGLHPAEDCPARDKQPRKSRGVASVPCGATLPPS